MNVKYLYDSIKPRAQVWCASSELTQDGDGNYTFKETVPPAVGTGSEIIVIDVPGLALFYDAEAGKAYNWTKGS